jgi:hypothetical protein
VLVSYTSERMLCQLLEGLVHGTAAHYGDDILMEETQCIHTAATPDVSSPSSGANVALCLSLSSR